jgi:hypothetical protein
VALYKNRVIVKARNNDDWEKKVGRGRTRGYRDGYRWILNPFHDPRWLRRNVMPEN